MTLASYCAQHVTGSTVQDVSEYLGLIQPGFAFASCLSTGDIADDLDAHLLAATTEKLEVVDPADFALDDPQAERRQTDFLR